MPAEGRRKEGFDMRVCQRRVTGGWRCMGGKPVSIVQRASWNRLRLPLHKPAAQDRSPEKLTLLNKGSQLLLSDIQQFP